MHWPFIGHALAMHWPFIGHALAMHWPLIGHALAVHRPCTGHAREMHWPFIGHALALHSACIGDVLGPRLTCAVTLFSQVGGIAAPHTLGIQGLPSLPLLQPPPAAFTSGHWHVSISSRGHRVKPLPPKAHRRAWRRIDLPGGVLLGIADSMSIHSMSAPPTACLPHGYGDMSTAGTQKHDRLGASIRTFVRVMSICLYTCLGRQDVTGEATAGHGMGRRAGRQVDLPHGVPVGHVAPRL